MPIPDVHRVMDLLQAGQPRAARPLIEALVHHAPGYVTAHVLLAHACEAERQWGDALTAWQQAYVLMPNSPVVQEGLRRVMTHIWEDKAAAAPEELPATPIILPTPEPETQAEKARSALSTSWRFDDSQEIIEEPTAEDHPDALEGFTQKPARYSEEEVVAPFYQEAEEASDVFILEAQPDDATNEVFADTSKEEVIAEAAAFALEYVADEVTLPDEPLMEVPDNTALAAALIEASAEEETTDAVAKAPSDEDALVPWEDDLDVTSPTLDLAEPPAIEEDALVPWEEDEEEPVSFTFEPLAALPETNLTPLAWEEEADLDLVDMTNAETPDLKLAEADTPNLELTNAAWLESTEPTNEEPDPLPEEAPASSPTTSIDDDIFAQIEQLIDAKLQEEGVADTWEDEPPPTESAEEEDFLGDGAHHLSDTFLPHFEGSDNLDHLIEELESARIVPSLDLNDIPAPDLDDEIEDMVSETLARIYASQKQYEEAARVYEQLAIQQPGESISFLQRAAEMRSLATGNA